ncbi:MAG: phenylalanine--tRNA ligase subunit beta, partial [Winogradskyella sp.]|nr:phenylalanine--tRNA ligase subunit beta [Winogradskyella sp.]
SQDLSVLRQSLLFTGLEAVSYNINRKKNDIKFFEFGKTYHQIKDNYEEYKSLGLLISGNKTSERWNVQTAKSNFFYMKGIIESILDRLGLNKLVTSPKTSDYLSEGLTIDHNNNPIVEFGIVNKSVTKFFGINQEVLYANFNWGKILSVIKNNAITYTDVPKYPQVRRDFALLVDDSVSFQSIHEIAQKTEKRLLKKIDLFDVYQGEKLPNGKKSYAVSFVLQDANKTLTDQQVDKIMGKLQTNFENELGASLR